MAERQPRDGDGAEPQPMGPREVVRLAAEHIADITGAEPGVSTSVLPTDDGWIIEMEVVEDRRIPSSADMLALYEVELDEDGELLGYRRTQRYMRGQSTSGARGGGPA